MTEHDDAGTLARRHLLRGGAVLAGAAGLSAVGAALAPRAVAADGQALVQGQNNTGTLTTTVTTTTAATALTLTNTQNGSVLRLTPRAAIGANEPLTLAAGEIVNTPSGPYIGIVGTTGQSGPAYLPTNFDLDNVASASPLDAPARLLDTRFDASRVIEGSSSTAPFDSAGRLRAGVWIDLAADFENDDYVADGAFVNLTALGAPRAGYLTTYAPTPTRPVGSSLNFAATVVTDNSAFVKLGPFAGLYLMRIFTSQTTHLIVDLTGISTFGPTYVPPTTQQRTQQRTQQPRPATRVKRTYRQR